MNEEELKEADIQKRMCQAVYPLGVLLIEKECKLEEKKEELKFLKERCIYCMIADERIKQLQKEIGGMK